MPLISTVSTRPSSSFPFAMTPDPILLDMSRKINVFDVRKAKVMAEIASPSPDASPKGSIDTQILPLITRLNEHADAFTTSSCSGRISVFLEGAKRLVESEPSAEEGRAPPVPSAGISGGKGEGGKWLFVSHDPVEITSMCDADIADTIVGRNPSITINCDQFDLSPASRFVHFKFETMILHIQTRTLEVAYTILSTALSSGFRESGIMNPALGKNQFPMVAIRSNGLAMDAIIGVLDEEGARPVQKLVTDSYIAMLVRVSNMRLIENARRIDKLTANLEQALFLEKDDRREGWESTEARRARKRAEGLKRQEEGRLAASTTELFGSGLACK